MPNSKKYIKEYMSKYNLTDKCREYKMSYYEKNKEKLKKLQRDYYHKHKFDETKSHYLEKRLILQKKYYKEKNPNSVNYENHMNKKKSIRSFKSVPTIKLNYGNYIIKFK